MIRGEEIVAGVLLAAGMSTRMGRPKQLLPAGDGTLIEGILKEALRSDLDRVILVLGHRHEEIRALLGKERRNPKLKLILNRRFKEGMSSSIKAGLSEVETSSNHLMILLGDMPFVDANLINRLIRHYLDSGLPLGAVKIKLRRSHPVIIGRELYHELHKISGDVGARSLFEKYNDRVCLVEPEGLYDDRDVDTPEDYTRYIKNLDRMK